MLATSSLTLFLCTQDFKAIGVKRSFIRACARPHARKTCFQRFGPNSANFYRIQIIFNVLWEPLKNLKQWLHFCYSDMAGFAVAGVFTYARIMFISPHLWKGWFSSDWNNSRCIFGSVSFPNQNCDNCLYVGTTLSGGRHSCCASCAFVIRSCPHQGYYLSCTCTSIHVKIYQIRCH